MLRMVQNGSGCCVLAYCDYCAEQIADCTAANVAYDGGGLFELVHKSCTAAYDRSHVGCAMDEMSHWLVFLEHNVGFDASARRTAEGAVHALLRAGLVAGPLRPRPRAPQRQHGG